MTALGRLSRDDVPPSARHASTPAERSFLASVPDLRDRVLLELGGCGERAPEQLPSLGELRVVAGAAALASLASDSADVVLFGGNGLDAEGDSARRDVLRELARVVRPGGHCGVSTHNLNNIARVLSMCERVDRLRGPRPPLDAPRRVAAMVRRNPPVAELLTMPWAYLADDTRLVRPHRTYYVTPDEMTRQVGAAGFEVVDVFAPDGDQVPASAVRAALPAWLFWSLRRTRVTVDR